MSVLPEPTPSRTPDRATLVAALRHANLPSLVPVLHQLTGDRRWLAAPYRPTRSRGMEDNDPGGFTDAVRDEICDAAADAVLAWSAGRAPAVPAPTGAELVELLELAVGEEVPAEFGEMAADDMGFAPADPRPAVPPSGFRVLVIGAGVSGILAAIRLREAGIEHVVLEKNDDVGGTWLENRYPGAGVDTPSHLYSYSFAPRQWSTHFGKRDEVLGYLREVAERHDLRRVIRFGTEVASAVYGEQRWTVTTTSGEVHEADAVITAVGVLNQPKTPDLPNDFTGPVFHSARWPEDLDVTGKRVAVVGTGASAMQIVPAIAERAAHVTVFQRSPQWAAHNDVYFTDVDAAKRLLLEHVPFYRRWYRTRLAWNLNDRVHPALQVDPEWGHPERSVSAANDAHRRVFTRHLEAELEGRADLLAKALPDYPPFGKRMLLDNGWFAALRRADVELITEPVTALTTDGVRAADGTESAADVVVLCTGFHAHRTLPFDVRGRDGTAIRDLWGDDDPDAHLGITVSGFPNLFLTCGPGTALGHGGSQFTVIECQVRYILDALTAMVTRGLGAVEVRPEVHADYVARHDAAHDRMIWTHPGMRNWYRNAAGRVVSTLPWRIVDYWTMTRRVDWDDFTVEPRV